MNIVITIEEIEARLPEVARWRALFNRLAAVTPSGLTPEGHLDTLLETRTLQDLTPPVLTVADHKVHTPPALTTGERVTELFRVALVTYGTTSKRWLTIPEAAEVLRLSPTTVRHYAELGVSEGDLITKVSSHPPGQRGRRPRLFSYNPKRAEIPHELHHRQDQEAPRSR